MAIEVRYFARVADITRRRTETWPLSEPIEGAQWLAQLAQRYPDLAPTGRLKLAINQEHAPPRALIRPGDEVAVFEAVTGG